MRINTRESHHHIHAVSTLSGGCSVYRANIPFIHSSQPLHFIADYLSDRLTLLLKCSLIEIDQSSHTNGVVLSKAAWMWGAEMGANEYGVCIGSSMVYSRLEEKLGEEEKLLAADLLRLTLERSKCSREAVDVLTSLLTTHGQSGPYSEIPTFTHSCKHCYSFLITDGSEVWVVETVGNGSFWAAAKVTAGLYSIHGHLTISDNFSLSSENLIAKVSEAGLYQESDGPFNFAKVFTPDNAPAIDAEISKAEELIVVEPLNPRNSFKHLRKDAIGINISRDQFVTASSQISLLCPQEGASSFSGSCHWFTATPNPKTSIFKPFIFSSESQEVDLPSISPSYGDDDPAHQKPRFQKEVDRKHKLYKSHMKLKSLLASGGPLAQQKTDMLQMLEETCLQDMEDTLNQFHALNPKKLASAFSHVAQLEMNFL
ncbi:secernin-3-like isoform X2 [Octopus vulgaris]|uniref:Secernin-3-like isoform X2 n=2 Tax=Octopus vulgaris TaxID=6645 RepID=A0AA36B580_OCTVU|nr:secernin-3-like isoform X2 [Octopus vulgaris]